MAKDVSGNPEWEAVIPAGGVSLHGNLSLPSEPRGVVLFAHEKQPQIVPGATRLFQEPGALEEVARSAREWFVRYLKGTGRAQAAARQPAPRTGGPS